MLLFTHHYLETYKPKSHCRRQSGMNFGYVTVNGVDSNVAGLHAIVGWIVCIIYGITTERKKEAASSLESCFHFLNYSLLS